MHIKNTYSFCFRSQSSSLHPSRFSQCLFTMWMAADSMRCDWYADSPNQLMYSIIIVIFLYNNFIFRSTKLANMLLEIIIAIVWSGFLYLRLSKHFRFRSRLLFGKEYFCYTCSFLWLLNKRVDVGKSLRNPMRRQYTRSVFPSFTYSIVYFSTVLWNESFTKAVTSTRAILKH